VLCVVTNRLCRLLPERRGDLRLRRNAITQLLRVPLLGQTIRVIAGDDIALQGRERVGDAVARLGLLPDSSVMTNVAALMPLRVVDVASPLSWP
jgi:hypothetical protein